LKKRIGIGIVGGGTKIKPLMYIYIYTPTHSKWNMEGACIINKTWESSPLTNP